MRAFLTGLGLACLAALATLAVVFLRIVPQRDERRRKEAEAFAVSMRRKAAEARVARTARVEAAVAVVEQQAATDKAADSVDVANRLIDG